MKSQHRAYERTPPRNNRPEPERIAFGRTLIFRCVQAADNPDHCREDESLVLKNCALGSIRS